MDPPSLLSSSISLFHICTLPALLYSQVDLVLRMSDRKLSVSAAVLVQALNDMNQSPSDTCGLIFGSSTTSHSVSLADAADPLYLATTSILIENLFILDSHVKYLDRSGRLDLDVVKHFIQGKESQLVGWFVFRRSSALRISVRDAAILSDLEKFMQRGDSTENSTPIFAVFTTCQNAVGDVIHFEYRFFHRHNSFVPAAPIHVTVLGLHGDSTAQYQAFTSTSSSKSHFVGKQSSSMDVGNATEVKECAIVSKLALEKMYHGAYEGIHDLVLQVVALDQNVAQLRDSIHKLESKEAEHFYSI